MLIKGFNITLDKSKRLWIEIIGAVIIAITLIVLSFFIITSIKKEDKGSNIEDIGTLFNLDSYYCEYNVTIKSNKNQNIYNIKEYYLSESENENIRFDFEDDKKNNIMTYIISNGTCKIKSENELNQFVISEGYSLKKKNLISISTFLGLFNKVKNVVDEVKTANECIKISTVEENQRKHFNIIFENNATGNNENIKNILNDYSDIADKKIGVKKLELVIDKNTNIPTELLIYNDKNEVYIAIEYTKFIINEKIEKKLFNF